MFTVLMPTRNRPESICHALEFFDVFYPGTRIVVADGSTGEFQPEVKSICVSFSKIDVDYTHYDPEIPYIHRIVEALKRMDDEFVLMAADDDFPLLDRFGKCHDFLSANDDYVVSCGAGMVMRYTSDDEYSANLKPSYHLDANNPARRLRNYSVLGFQTSYALSRRRHLLERYERFKHVVLTGFYDFTVGTFDSVAGKIHATGEITYVGCLNASQDHPRPSDRLIYLRKADIVLKIIEQLAQDLQDYGNLDSKDAYDQAARVHSREIARKFGKLFNAKDVRDQLSKEAFGYDPIARPEAQAQIEDFQQMFRQDDPVRESMLPRLKFIRDAQRAIAIANKGRVGTKVEEM